MIHQKLPMEKNRNETIQVRIRAPLFLVISSRGKCPLFPMQRLPQQEPGHGGHAQGGTGKRDRLFRLPQDGGKPDGKSAGERPQLTPCPKGHGGSLHGVPRKDGETVRVAVALAW